MAASSPVLSVVMSVYNGADKLKEAVDSVINQSFSDFEFIIIDDGSTDDTPQILKSYKDKRVRIISQQNRGLVASLNRGIKSAKGKYIARQDADDRSHPDRFKKQIEFLSANPDVVIAGTSINVINLDGKQLHRHSVLINDPELRQELLLRSPFAHGSVMFLKKAALEAGLYKQDIWPAEDYDLWLRISQLGKIANLDEYLYDYREHEKSISSANQLMQIEKKLEVQAEAWKFRKQLTPQKLNLAFYKNKEHGEQRIERIIDNVRFVVRRARQKGEFRFAFYSLALTSGHVVTYKKIAGKIKRRILKNGKA